MKRHYWLIWRWRGPVVAARSCASIPNRWRPFIARSRRQLVRSIGHNVSSRQRKRVRELFRSTGKWSIVPLFSEQERFLHVLSARFQLLKFKLNVFQHL